MMVQPVATRSQRRMEKKQLVLIVILILAVSVASFSLGVMFGKQNPPASTLVESTRSAPLPAVAQVTPPPPPAAEAPKEQADNLTFYENLPKGNQAPLGSGINLPPKQEKPVVETSQKAVVKPAAPPPRAEAVATIASAKDGAFVVQVASFRNREEAGKLAGRLKGYQLTAFVESADLGEKGTWYRVLAGPYAQRASADQAVALLRDKERLSALVRQR